MRGCPDNPNEGMPEDSYEGMPEDLNEGLFEDLASQMPDCSPPGCEQIIQFGESVGGIFSLAN